MWSTMELELHGDLSFDQVKAELKRRREAELRDFPPELGRATGVAHVSQDYGLNDETRLCSFKEKSAEFWEWLFDAVSEPDGPAVAVRLEPADINPIWVVGCWVHF